MGLAMPASAGKENRSCDRRWLVLAMAALFIATAAPLGRLASEIRAPCYGGAEAATSNWAGLDLSWRKQGARGEGLYLEPDGKTWIGPAVGRSTAVDPRLAIFTYRPIDLNRADAEVLQTIKGIGPKLAGAIVGYRLSKGPFRSLDELLLVKGIGPAKLANLRRKIMVVRVPD